MIVSYCINDPVLEVSEHYFDVNLNEILDEFYNLPEEEYAMIGLIDEKRYEYRILYRDYDKYLTVVYWGNNEVVSSAVLTYDECVEKIRKIFDKGFIFLSDTDIV